MGGDIRPDGHHQESGKQAQNDASAQLLAQLNQKLTQDSGDSGQTRAGYGAAPLTDNLGQKPHSSDPYYHGPANRPGRAGYGVSGTLAPGGAGDAPNKPGGDTTQPPDFRTIHQDQARDPNKPYDRNTMGVPQQGQGQTPGLPGRPEAHGSSGADNRIQNLVNTRGLYMSGWTPFFGGVGAATAPLTAKMLSHGADGLVARTKEGSFGHRAGQYWQNNYDASRVGKGDLVKPNETKAAEVDFARMVEKERGAVTSAPDAAAKQAAQERLNFLERPMNASSVSDMKATNIARAEASKPALFTEAEMKTIEGKYAASVANAQQEQAIIKGLQSSGPSVGKMLRAGMVGVGVDMLAVNADRALGKYIGGENSLLKSWNTEQLLAPTALALAETVGAKSILGKTALIAGTIGVSRVIDKTTQAIGLGAPDAINAPMGVMNGYDGFGVGTGLAIAAVAKNPWAKFGAVAVGYGIPKIIHAFQDNSSDNPQRVFANVQNDLQADHQKRSYGSLEDVTNASTKLKEDWLVSKIESNRQTMSANWNSMGTDTKLLAFRDDAAMSRAVGESLLQKGTRIAKQGDPEYTLGGYQIDLGGRGMHYLLSSKDSADRAAEMTKAIIANNNDSSKTPIEVNGSKPDQSEVDGLNRFHDDLQKDLAKILTQHHDIPAVIAQVVKNVPVSSDDWRQTYIRPTDGLIEHYAPRNSPAQAAETRLVLAKLYRDQAVAYLAFAQSKMDHGGDGQGALAMLQNNPNNHNDIFPSGRPKNYNGAEGVIEMAAKFDPDNKDLVDIRKAYQDMLPKAQDLANKQTNGKLNILNVDNGNPTR